MNEKIKELKDELKRVKYWMKHYTKRTKDLEEIFKEVKK